MGQIYELYISKGSTDYYSPWESQLSTACVCDLGKIIRLLFNPYSIGTHVINFIKCSFHVGYTGANCEISTLDNILNFYYIPGIFKALTRPPP